MQIDLEPYHPLGIDKARRLGRAAAYDKQDPPDPGRLQRYGKWLEKTTGIPVSV